ncbi:dihydrodipicolinate synthase family protein [Natrinema versiforme]|uniref:Dihydrodipicolinate synthase family protein n=1 Tax=Natrinema versiforme TaxID=88724 RepID=A0A4P8WRF3_9EURY|nr:dihydrodipicolinate synthase family protein [Natrinema versiforme]QCS44701.1 dihydrodipicolinate synthase family protein [Natrinema versiforme]
MEQAFSGIFAPVLTPIKDGSVATEIISESVKFTQACGCHGLIAAGTGVQETVSLTVDERKKIISGAIKAADERPVLAGVSHPSTHITLELAAYAETAGADGILAMPPWGLSPGNDAVISYYESLVEATDLPILLYNNPTVTVDLSTETMRRIARLENVEYVKETSRNWKKLAWLIEHVDNAGLASVFGTMDVLLPVMEAGGHGAVIPAPASTPAMRVYEAFQNGDREAAGEAQRAFVDFPPDEVNTSLMPAVKAAANLSGVPLGPPRPPYQPVSDEGQTAIQQWLEREDVPSLE